MSYIKSKNDLINEIKRKEEYNNKTKDILECNVLTADEKQLLIDGIKLPVNHTTGYYALDDDEEDVNLLTEEEKIKYGIF